MKAPITRAEMIQAIERHAATNAPLLPHPRWLMISLAGDGWITINDIECGALRDILSRLDAVFPQPHDQASS